MRASGLLVALALAGCGQEERARAASDNVVAGFVDKGEAWPLLLAHCLRATS